MLTLVTLALSIGCYLVFAGEVGTTEIIAAIPAAGLVTAFAFLRHRGQDRPMRLRAPWGRLLSSASMALFQDIVRVGVHLWHLIANPRHDLDGTIDRQPFRPGGQGREDAGRAALVTLATSFAPNGFVLDVAPSILLGDEAVLLMHHLVPTPPDPDPEWPM